jgi:hypothetical protein
VDWSSFWLGVIVVFAASLVIAIGIGAWIHFGSSDD